jgi:hypothetical protein
METSGLRNLKIMPRNAEGPLRDLSQEEYTQRKELLRREWGGVWLVMIKLISILEGNIIVATSRHDFPASSVNIPEM